MNTDLRKDIESAVHGAEVGAVVRAMEQGQEPRLGDLFNYALDLPASLCKRKQSYRFAVEQWHLDAARIRFVPSRPLPRDEFRFSSH
jgi:hypothetical protein